MAASNKKFILVYSIIAILFSLNTFASEHSNTGLYELVDFLNEYEEIDFYDKEKFYEFETTLHAFNKRSKRIPVKITRQRFEQAIMNSLDKNVKKSARPLMRAIVSLSEKYQVDPYWVTAMIWTESHFRIQAKSDVGASGLMQVMPGTFRFLKRKMKRKGIVLEVDKSDHQIRSLTGGHWGQNLSKFKSILENLEVGIFYIKRLNKQFNNSKYATVAYNMGPNWVKRTLKKQKEVGSSQNQYLNKVKKYYAKLVKAEKHLNITLAMLN